MQSSVKDFLLQILTIIEYTGDKERFADKLLILAQEEAILNLLNTLSPQVQQELKKKLSTSTSKEAQQEILMQQFTQQAYVQSIYTSLRNILEDYTKTLSSHLSQEQKNKLEEFFLSPFQ